MKLTYVYILKLKNGDVYKGVTSDLRRRFQEHRLGKVASTRHYRPFVMLGYEAYSNSNDARRRESYLKTSNGKKFLKQQYKDALQ